MRHKLFHDDVKKVLLILVFEKLDDVPVVDLAHDLDFAHHRLEDLGIVLEPPLVDLLDCDLHDDAGR